MASRTPKPAPIDRDLHISFHLRDDSHHNLVVQQIEQLMSDHFPDQYTKVFSSVEQKEIVYRIAKPVFGMENERSEFVQRLEFVFNVTAMHYPHFTQYKEVTGE